MARVKFGDVVKRANTKEDRFNTDKEFYVGGEHMLTGEYLVTKRGIIKGSTIGPMFYFGFKEGQVLLASRSPDLRKAGLVTFDGICSEKTFVLETADDNVLLQEFLPIIVRSDAFWEFANDNQSGSVNHFINWTTFARYEFELPPIEEQKRIANALWSMIDLRQKYENLLVKTDELVKSQFIEMTKGLETIKLSEVCTSYGRGKTPKYVEDSSVHVLNQACIYWDGFHLENVKYQNEEKFNPSNALEEGDVLLNSTGTGTLGRARVFDIKDGYTYMADSHVSVLKPRKDLILPKVLQYYFYDDNNQSDLNYRCVFGSTSQDELSKDGLGKMPIPLIKMRDQVKFVQIIEQSDKSKFEIKNCIEQLNKMIRNVGNNSFI